MAGTHDYEGGNRSLEADDSLDEIVARKPAQPAGVEQDEDELAREVELAGTDEVTDELTVRIVPVQQNEFTCRSCFLVKHRSQLADEQRTRCRDCV